MWLLSLSVYTSELKKKSEAHSIGSSSDASKLNDTRPNYNSFLGWEKNQVVRTRRCARMCENDKEENYTREERKVKDMEVES